MQTGEGRQPRSSRSLLFSFSVFEDTGRKGAEGAQPEDDRQPVTGNRSTGGEEERTQYREQEQGCTCCSKTPKSWQEPDHFRPPPLQNKVVFGSGPSAQNRYITSTLRVSEFFLSLRKRIAMMYNDLTVKNGRLINTRPNDVTGIQKAVQMKKELKRSEKIATMSEAMFQAEMKADLVESLRESRMKDDD